MDASFGKYTVVGRLGLGGMADVYLCRLVGIGGFDKHVVVKRIRADIANNYGFVEMFLDEARLAANLNHPNIVQVFEIDMLDGLPYMAMEYVPGQTLAAVIQALRTRGKFDFANIAHVMAEVCAGLHHAHNARDAEGRSLEIVHRDISPQNIIISNDGIAKVFDFGVAKAMGKLGATDAGTVKGKVGYMAPEQLRARPVDARADVYAVGVCLYEATVGERPFRGFTEGEMFAARVEGVFTLPSIAVADYPLELERIVLSAMSPEPSDRPDAAALGDALRAFALAANKSAVTVAGLMLELFPDGTPPPAPPRSGKLLAVTGSNPEALTTSERSPVRGIRVDMPTPTHAQRSTLRTAVVMVGALALGGLITYLVLESNTPVAPVTTARSNVDDARLSPALPDAPIGEDVALAVTPDAAPAAAQRLPDSEPEPPKPDLKRGDRKRKTPPPPKRPPPKKVAIAPAPLSTPMTTPPVTTPPVTTPTTTPPVTAPPVTTPPATTPPVTTPPVTTPPTTTPTAAIAAPRLPATFSARNIKELGKVLDVIEGEAINRGKAPASIRGVTEKLAESAYSTFVPGDFIELHPREIYYVIVRGVRGGKSKAAIATELKGML